MAIEDIQSRMAQIRHDMHGDVLVAVKGARSLTDWRSLARNYPWLTLGVAAAIGYMVVPRRRSETPTIVALNATAPEVAPLVERQEESDKTRGRGWSIMGTVFSLVAPIAVRAAQNCSMQYIEGLLAQHKVPPEETERDRVQAGNGARSAGPWGPSGRLREPRWERERNDSIPVEFMATQQNRHFLKYVRKVDRMIAFASPRSVTSTSAGESVNPLIGSAGEIAAEARERLAEAEEFVKTVVTNRPLLAIGAALAAGVILGWLIKRRW
jgi:ElaB/YqjD/DUF883 family membrane-anchored ribosome-binding protein